MRDNPVPKVLWKYHTLIPTRFWDRGILVSNSGESLGSKKHSKIWGGYLPYILSPNAEHAADSWHDF